MSILIPTPDQVDYSRKGEYLELVNKLSKRLQSRRFTYFPEWGDHIHLNALKIDFAKSGWSITTAYNGQPGDAQAYWKFTPLKEK